eukprot:117886-Karenia_brevis.AAC.1
MMTLIRCRWWAATAGTAHTTGGRTGSRCGGARTHGRSTRTDQAQGAMAEEGAGGSGPGQPASHKRLPFCGLSNAIDDDDDD